MKVAPIYLTGFFKSTFGILLFVIGLLSVSGAYIAAASEPRHFWMTYLVAFIFCLTLSLGSLFFVMVHYLSRAAWGVVFRRISESLMILIPLVGLFFIPIIAAMPEIFFWTHPGEAMRKLLYLNTPFFVCRAVFYFAIWTGFSVYYYRASINQDKTGETGLAVKLARIAPVGILLYALTQTFAGIDWVMSLSHAWFSTMFPVEVFSASVISALCLAMVLMTFLRKISPMFRQWANLEHYHALAKLIYGFNLLWALAVFTQYFVTWYANLPEETVFYIPRTIGAWHSWVPILVFGHFFIPFFLWMSRHVKRNIIASTLVALLMLGVQYLHWYWMIVPSVFPEGLKVGLLDASVGAGMMAMFLGAFFCLLGRRSIVAYRDPWLAESLSLDNSVH